MAEYIKRDAAIAVIEEQQRALCPMGRCGRHYVYGTERDRFDAWEEIADRLRAIPVEDAAPAKHGHWVLEAEKGGCMDFHVRAHCSMCGHEWFSKNGVGNYSYVFSAFVRGPDEDAISFVLNVAKEMKIDNYCPNCGAKMDEEVTHWMPLPEPPEGATP